MKKLKIFTAMAALILLCASAGCGNNGGTAESSPASVASEDSVKEGEAELAGQWQSETLPDYIYTFNADGTGQYDMAGNVLEMTYTTDDGRITISFTAEGYTPVTLNYELDGDRLNIKDSFGKDTFYQRVKQ